MRSSPYLVCLAGWYHFRVRVPSDVQPFFGRREVKRSLRTRSLKDARVLVRRWAFRAERTFTLIRTGMLTEDQIRRLTAEFLADRLEPSEFDTDHTLDAAVVPWEDRQGLSMRYSDLMEECDEEWRRGDYRRVADDARRLLGSQDAEERDYRVLSERLLKALVLAYGVEGERLDESELDS